MSILDLINGSDRAAQAGHEAGGEAGGLALGAYDRNAVATLDKQNPNQRQADTADLVKGNVIPDLHIDYSKSMSGDAGQPKAKIGEVIGDLVYPGKAIASEPKGESKGAHGSSSPGEALPPSGSLPILEKTAGLPVKTF